MKPTTIENGKITSTLLGYEDHGILTAYVTIEGDGWGCAFGGFGLDAYDAATKQRVGTAYGCQFLIETMKAVGVTSWEKLVGQHVRVETEGWGGRILRIGHITKNLWFDPKALAEKMRDTVSA